ncbi:hypothetical protein BMR05_16500 [Methylococcaceae bacterium HT4]|nr:hypothetical protein BMR05_16500 [Methylococcaceae bacterium HT4]
MLSPQQKDGSVAIIIKSADLLVFRHNYPAKAIMCFKRLPTLLRNLKAWVERFNTGIVMW